jgi:ATP-dependent protease ClpP protease subunit
MTKRKRKRKLSQSSYRSNSNSSDDEIDQAESDSEEANVEVKQTSYREILFNGEINRVNVAEFGILLRKMSAKMQRFAWRRNERFSDDMITIFLTSDGGEVEAGFAAADMIANIDVYVKVIIVGVAASAATLLAMAATAGLDMYENSTMLIHQLSTGLLNGTVREIEDFNYSAKQLHSQMIKFYLEKCPALTKTILLEIMQHDRVLNSTECLKQGLISKIV